MLQSPTTESQETTQASHSAAKPEPRRELHPPAPRGAVDHAPQPGGPRVERSVPAWQRAIGNQGVLRLLSHSTPAIQTKLVINQPGDKFEHEADRVAELVMRMADPSAPVAASSAPEGLQRKCSCESSGSPCTHCQEKEDEKMPHLQRLASATTASASASKAFAPPIVGDVLRTPGIPLAPSTRQFMEPRFGYDFGQVRLHLDSSAAASASSVGALAYTVGSHVVFGAGNYAPQTESGRRMLAHELAHVVQQTSPRTSAAGLPTSRSETAVQRSGPDQPPTTGADCPTEVPPGAASGRPQDHFQGPSGTYYIYGPRYSGESADSYGAATIDAWIVWRFGDLSAAVTNRIRTEASPRGWRWGHGTDRTPPSIGCQATLVLPMADVIRLARLAGYDVKERKHDKKEKAVGLPEPPDPYAIGDDIVIVASAPPVGPSGVGGDKSKDKLGQGEEALDPTSVYNKGAAGANFPPFPASLEGPEMEVPKGTAEYTMRLQYEAETDDPAMLLAYSMNSVTNYWEMFDITNILMRGMAMGSSMVEEARRTQELAQNLDTNSQASDAASGAAGQHVRNDLTQLSDEKKDALRELRDPVKAAAGGSAIDVVSRAYANALSLELLPASAIRAAGGWVVDEIWTLIGSHTREREISFPEAEGFYMVRCIAQPGPRGPNRSERRGASVRAKIVEVRKPETLAKNALDMADAAIASYQLQQLMTSDPAERAEIDRKIDDIRGQSSGDLVDYLTRVVAEKEAQLKQAPSWRQGELQRELEPLQLRLTQAKEKRSGTGSLHIRPQVAFTSTFTGETYPLMIELSPIPVTDGDGNEVPNRKKVRLFDATVPDREKIDREGATLEQAVANAFEIFRKNGDLGPGILFVRMPDTWKDWKGDHEFTLRVSASGGALVKQRLADLATVLLALSVVVPGVGEVSMAIAAGLAAERLISRLLNNTLRPDAASISDALTILGAVAQGAQIIGKLRIVKSGDAFIGAVRSFDQKALEAAAGELQAAIKVGRILDMTSTVVNAGGMIWGDITMIKSFADLQTQEINGKITHAEAMRQRANMLANAFLQHGIMLHGMMQGQAAESARPESQTPENTAPTTKGTTAKPADPPAPPKAADHAVTPSDTAPAQKLPDAPAPAPKAGGPPETIPEPELEKLANDTTTQGTPGQTPKKPDAVRARFSTPDLLHEIFILEDGRIFRCSLLCSQLRDWYSPYLNRQPEGARSQRAAELSTALEALEVRARSKEQSDDLNREIGKLDVAIREFIVPDLARELQHSAAGRTVGKGQTFLTEPQVTELLKFFNLDEIVAMTGEGGLASAQSVRGLAELLRGIDKVLEPGERETLRPILGRIAEGGPGAAENIDFLNRVARLRDQGIKFNLAELEAAFQRGDAILDHGPIQPKSYLADLYAPYELEGGRLKFNGMEVNMPKIITRKNGRVDFVIFQEGGTYRMILGWDHTGLSDGRAFVFGAGELYVNGQGFVVKITRKSGHYRPSEANLIRSIQFMIDKGLLLDPAVAKAMNRPAFEIVRDF